MRFVLMTKLCRACFASESLKDKLHYQCEIEKVRHHVMFELQGEECSCGEEGCDCNYIRISGLMMDLEFACSDCLQGDEALMASLLEYFIRDERRMIEAADLEYEEEIKAKTEGRRSKIARLSKVKT